MSLIGDLAATYGIQSATRRRHLGPRRHDCVRICRPADWILLARRAYRTARRRLGTGSGGADGSLPGQGQGRGGGGGAAAAGGGGGGPAAAGELVPHEHGPGAGGRRGGGGRDGQPAGRGAGRAVRGGLVGFFLPVALRRVSV